MSLTQELSLFFILLSALPYRTFHIKNMAANFKRLEKNVCRVFGQINGHFLDFGGMYVTEVACSFTKIGAP